VERSNAYSYFKNKLDTIKKSLVLLDSFEQFIERFVLEDKERYQKEVVNGDSFKGLEQEWLGNGQNPDVAWHYPPQLIIGKQVVEDKEVFVYDENPNVRVVVYEIACQWSYSNPTALFNVSIPHIELRTNNYQTLSYSGYKKMVEETNNNDDQTEDTTPETTTPKEVVTKNWFSDAKEGPVILKLVL
jgi:hypothetical protein